MPVDNTTRVAISQWAGEAQAAFGWVENREWLVWGGEYSLLNLVKEVCDEKAAAAEKARKVVEAMEVKKQREEQAAKEREEREAAAAARKLEFKERHHALRAAFK